jgi:hypothetical protein
MTHSLSEASAASIVVKGQTGEQYPFNDGVYLGTVVLKAIILNLVALVTKPIIKIFQKN